VKVNVEIERATKTLNQSDGTGLCCGLCVTAFSGHMGGNSAVDNAQYLTHDGGLTGEQKTQWEREAEDPLAHGLKRQDFVYQQGSTVRHSSRPTARAKTAPLAAKSDQFFIMARLALDPEKAILKSPAFQILIEFFCDVGR